MYNRGCERICTCEQWQLLLSIQSKPHLRSPSCTTRTSRCQLLGASQSPVSCPKISDAPHVQGAIVQTLPQKVQV